MRLLWTSIWTLAYMNISESLSGWGGGWLGQKQRKTEANVFGGMKMMQSTFNRTWYQQDRRSITIRMSSLSSSGTSGSSSYAHQRCKDVINNWIRKLEISGWEKHISTLIAQFGGNSHHYRTPWTTSKVRSTQCTVSLQWSREHHGVSMKFITDTCVEFTHPTEHSIAVADWIIQLPTPSFALTILSTVRCTVHTLITKQNRREKITKIPQTR